LWEEPVIDAHRYTADVAIHVHIIVTHYGQSFKTPPAYHGVSDCTREASAAPAASFKSASGKLEITLALAADCGRVTVDS